LVAGVWTTQTCCAKTVRPVPKAGVNAAAPANATAHQGAGAKAGTDVGRNAATTKIEAGNPIDTRIPEPRRTPPNNSRPIDAKKIGVVGLPSLPSQAGAGPRPLALPHGQTLGPVNRAIASPGAAGLTRNAIGATARNVQTAPTAIGRKSTPVAAGAGIPAAAPRVGEAVAAARPALGTPATVAGRLNASLPGRAGPPPPVVAANHGIINGTAISRPVSGPATIGGAAKNAPAGISGTGYRPKHP